MERSMLSSQGVIILVLIQAMQILAFLSNEHNGFQKYSEQDLKSARETDARMMNALKDQLENYDPKMRPNYTGSPTYVYVDFSIVSIGRVKEVDMVLPVDMFFRQIWRDYRLRHTLNESIILMMGQRHPSEIIWVPDTTFINAVHATRHHVTVNNDKLDVYPDGKVFWGMRATVMASCKLDLRAYPMDSQSCEIGIESYAYTDDHVIYRWRVNPGVKLLNSDMDQYALLSHKTTEETKSYVAGSYSLLYCTFTFERKIAYALIQVYVPVVAIVFVSWVSLWIHRDSTAARVALCVTTLLTICTIWGNINSQLPRVNYIKAIDIYLMTSFCFVFCTLVEYTLVLNIDGRNRRHFRSTIKKHSAGDRHDRTDPDEREGPGRGCDDEMDLETPRAKRFLPRFLTRRRNSSAMNHYFIDDCESGLQTNFQLTRYRKCNTSSTGQFGMDYRKTNGIRNGNHVTDHRGNGHASDGPFSRKKPKRKMRETSTIDLIARALFPMSFALFNILYWAKFLRHKTVF